MRILLVALAIAWLSATGAAFEAGRRAEAEYRAAVEALTRDAVPVSLARYERGVFGSEAVIVLGPATLAEGEVSATRLVLRQRIDHGPYPFSWIASEAFDGRPIVARVEAVPTLEIEGPEVIEEVPLPVVVRALFTRGDRASIRLIPDPEADALDDPELSADWRAMHAEVGFAYDGSAISGDLAVPRVAWEREDASFRLEGLALALDLARAAGPAPAFVGRTRLRVGLLSVAGPDGGFTLRDLEMENGSEIGPGGWSLRVDGSLGAVEERAPGLAAVSRRVGGGELGLRLAHVDLEPLAELESVASVAEGEGPASDEAKAELLGAVVAL
ncbi:MAG TPA: DUF945 family protein, partial [Myxococcota bacterium]|nr:DUF945 family protein [Myxococcota bacterium]